MKTMPSSIGEYFALPPSDFCNSHSLSAGVAESAPVPNTAQYALFAATGDFYVGYGTTVAIPADILDGSSPELNPTMRYIAGFPYLSLIAPADCKVTVSYFK